MTPHLQSLARRAAAATALLAAVALPAAIAAPSADAAAPASPPPFTVLSSGHVADHGDLFVTPTSDTAQTQAEYANGAEILTPAGKKVWFHAAAPGTVDGDLRVQSYEGKKVLTFWEGTGFGGLSNGTDYIYNTHYKQIAAVHAGAGLTTDGHEFRLISGGRAWVISYDTATENLTSIGGAANQTVVDCIIQLVEVKTGKVLFSWDADKAVPFAQSEEPLPSSPSTPWDWFHANAVSPGPNGTWLIDARDTWTVYDVDPKTGAIDWQLGGKASTFSQAAGPGQTLNAADEYFAWQHDPEWIGNDTLTVFDDESAGTANTGTNASSELPYSRVVTIALDPSTKSSTLVASDNQPEAGLASSQGNAQHLSGGGELVGWGILNSVSQFNAAGRLVWNGTFPIGVNTYRAYLDPWTGSR